MTVILTSPVLGKGVGDDYTGTLEDWLLSEGYARKANYTGPGVKNTGPTVGFDVTGDPTLAENREAPYWPLDADTSWTIANDATNLNKLTFPAKGVDVDNDGEPDAGRGSDYTLTPNFGPEAGGTEVTLTGTDMNAVTAVNFSEAAITDITHVNDTTLKVTSPSVSSAGSTNSGVYVTRGAGSLENTGTVFSYGSEPLA